MNAPPSHLLQFGDFRVDLDERRLFRADGTEVLLTPRVFETLRYLVEHAGRVVDKRAIMDAVWADCIVEENNLAQAISKLRQVFGEKTGAPRYIATLPGRGYRFVAPVKTGNGSVVAGIADPAFNRNISVSEKPGSTIPATTREISQQPARGRAGSTAAVLGLLLILAAIFWWGNATKQPAVTPPNEFSASIPDKSIAVLPFANLSSDPDTAYFAEGIKDEILTRLSKIAALKVISRTSTQEFALKPHNVREIAQRLGVAHVLEGSVQKSGDAVRVTVQLIHAPSDTHLWAESYDRKLIDIFQVETEIARRIAAALAATLTGSEKSALAARPTANFAAYQAYLQGRYFWNKRTIEGFKESVEYFNRAIQADPGYAQAYVGLADAFLFLDSLAPPEEAVGKARTLLKKALELDETLPEAHASLGLIAMNVDWDWAEAERQFKRAIELNSNYATAPHWYGEFLAYMGRFDEGIAEIKRAHELDPLSLIINTDVGKVHFLARRYDEGISYFRAALRLDPEFAEAHGYVALAYSAQGKHAEAVDELRKIKALETHPGYLSFLAWIQAAGGRKDESRQTIDRLIELSQRTYVSPVWMAAAWTGFGDKDEAFKWFERVFAERASGGALSLKVNPLFDSLRSDPRYSYLLRRANFAP
jgi:TolB-like protein/DNA-binding winged helix-turn-helix (wHTH) protein/Tfp pilus assembly protein PilF